MKPEYEVSSSWLTRDHMRNCDVYPQYLERIATFEQRLRAKLLWPRHTNWTFFGNTRGHTQRISLGFDWTDHPAAFDGGDMRYLVTQPYIGTQVWQECPKIALARHWSEVMGFDHFEALDPSLGFWNPRACHVFVLSKRRP